MQFILFKEFVFYLCLLPLLCILLVHHPGLVYLRNILIDILVTLLPH